MIIYLLPHDHEIVESVHHTRQLDCVTLVHHHVLWLQRLKKIDYDERLESKLDLYLGHELGIPLVDDLLVAGGVEDLVAGVGVGVVIVVVLLIIVVVGVIVLIRSIRRVACGNIR